MKYIHIKNLDKYNPGYTDRSLIWCKVYFSMINSSYDFEVIDDIDKWRLIALIMLELQMKKPIPLDETWLLRKISSNKRPISSTLKMLHNFIEYVTEDGINDETHVTQSRVDKSRVEKSRVEEEGKEPLPKKSLGENNLVLLTPPEEVVLKTRLAGKFSYYVDAVDGYIKAFEADKKKKFEEWKKKDHYQTILNWARKDGNLKDANEVDGLSEAERKIIAVINRNKGLTKKDEVVDLLFEFPFNRDFIAKNTDPDLYREAVKVVEKVTEENKNKFGDILKDVGGNLS